ncbi:low temperature requirement protein A [Sphaerotilus sp.]|uniref:low temperature requirement protein A n=1 Tax=Sphaerotilus sp. TaxID=2093942 RepID=UPI002ACED580|nr:low temperature requirement protein A [Sphaerotilus sp.]MDZ7858168.1 low temperature requirement protein A [Sphaerotilus sp.]
MTNYDDLPRHAEGRKATWFELFFDLVFVVAVAQLSSAYAHHYDLGGALVFALAFLAMWWCWLGHTFHATRFDNDSGRQRGLGFLQIVAVALIGYGVSDPLGNRAWAFGGGIGAFKVLLMLAYLGELRWRGAAGLIRVYAVLYAVQALLWLTGAAAEALRWAAWGLALGMDLASPWLVARQTAAVPPHPEHLPERFGLFTIILLGEGMAAVVHALDHGEHLHLSSAVAALVGAALSFGLWLLYFHRVKGQGERHISDAVGGRRLRLWAYGHVPLYMGTASLAAGTVALSAPGALTANSGAIYLGGLTLAVVGLSLLNWARQPSEHA